MTDIAEILLELGIVNGWGEYVLYGLILPGVIAVIYWLIKNWRKIVVALKRRPQIIPLLVLLGGFVYYSLNMTKISNTTAVINRAGMGLSSFVIMLGSILSLVCFLRAYPHRKKIQVPMLVLTYVLLVLIIICDFYYKGVVIGAIMDKTNRISISQTNMYIVDAVKMLQVHTNILACGIGLMLTLPIYSRWIRKIRTTIEVEENKDMTAIDLNDEDA